MKKFKDFFINSFAFYLAIELVEQTIENIIVLEISNFLLKFLATFSTVFATYTFKTFIKFIVSKITYKEGNDKVDKIKQFFTWLFCNKKTVGAHISMFVGSVTAVLNGTGVIDISTLLPIYIGGFNIMPILFYGLLTVVVLIGAGGKGWEKISDYFARVAKEKANKDVESKRKSLEKEAKKLIADKKKQEKADAKAKEAAKTQEEKEAEEKAHQAEVEAVMAELLKKEQEKEQEKTQEQTANV